jgi:DNA polymerase III gamma/tau subunit
MRIRSWEAERSRFVASLSGGSLGRALAKEEEDLFTLRDGTISDLSSVLNGGICQILDLAETWAKGKDQLWERLDYLFIWVRDLRIYQKTHEEALLVNRDLASRIREEASSFPPEVLGQFFQIIQETNRGISRYANARLSLEAMFIRMRRALSRKEEMAYAECGED